MYDDGFNDIFLRVSISWPSCCLEKVYNYIQLRQLDRAEAIGSYYVCFIDKYSICEDNEHRSIIITRFSADITQ